MRVERKAEVFRTEVSQWAHLAELIDHFSYFNGHAWLFRGATDAQYVLVPKIGRPISRSAKYSYDADDEASIIAMFKQQAMPYLQSPPAREIEWLAVAQHYGLPTRFLDWTDSLLVAAWFAVTENTGTDGAIWVTRKISAVSQDKDLDQPLKISGPKSYRPPHISGRIGVQGSVLLVCPKPTEPLAPAFLEKIVIDEDAKFLLKKRLNACGMNGRALFPDLAGLCSHLAWLYKHDWLSGYRKELSGSLAMIAATHPDLAHIKDPYEVVDEGEDKSERD